MKTNKSKFDALPLRQRKMAKTKVALLHALLEVLEKESLENISIKSLCQQVEISEPTFFNYFKTKQDMLTYFIQLWSIEMAHISQHIQSTNKSVIEVIEAIFEQTGKKLSEHVFIMLEIISFQAKINQKVTIHDITLAEKWLQFPNIAGVEKLPSLGIESILPPLLLLAKQNGELDEDVDTDTLFLSLCSIFFGIPLLVGRDNPSQIPMLYKQQLQLLFKGISHEK